MSQWAYKVVYIDYRGHISCEGVKTMMTNERHSTFVRRYMDTLGREGWELVGIQPLTSITAYYIFKRPAQESDFAEPAPEQPAEQASPTIETA